MHMLWLHDRDRLVDGIYHSSCIQCLPINTMNYEFNLNP